MSTKSSVTPPGPIPAGLVPLVDCAAALAAHMGDGDLSRPVEIWRHNETGKLTIEPDPQRLHKLLEVYRDIVLDALRMGNDGRRRQVCAHGEAGSYYRRCNKYYND